MAKKKKTQLKPVVRGFATTSVPKKVVEIQQESEAEPAQDAIDDKVEQLADVEPSASGSTTQLPSDGFDPDKVEEQSLQNLVDKFQDRIEKEVVRTVKSIEQEQRFSDTFQRLEIDPAFTERIINLILESQKHDAVMKTVDEPEEKVIPRLAITYGVLRRLGFSESRVEECLNSINGIDLDDAYEWLHLHCSEDEIVVHRVNSDATEVNLVKTPKSSRGFSTTSTTPFPQTPRTPVQLLMSNPLPIKSESRLDVNAPTFIPSSPFLSSRAEPFLEQDSLETTPYLEGDHDSATQNFEHDDLHDPTAAFVQLRMQIADLTTHRRPGETRDAAFLDNLHKRLQNVKKNYFFDEDEAEQAYQAERVKADADALKSRLRGIQPPSETVRPQKRSIQPPPNLQPAPPSHSATVTDLFDEDSDDLPGGMFDILQEPATEITDDGTTIEIRDMAPPKHYSGRTPKTLLMETVYKSDRYAVISYRCISGSSRAKRAAVTISGRIRNHEWQMLDIACYDMSQAEQYISTVALHGLTFRSQEGFALGNTTAAGAQTSFRLLPPIYRDLWNELEEKRRTNDDAHNRAVWAKLRTILEPKLNADFHSNSKIVKPTASPEGRAIPRNVHQFESLSEEIISDFKARQASPAYQEMLQQRNSLPIAAYRHEILSVLESSQILVLSGETGCGKSTQVPAFILEDQLSQGKHCKIYCTEPRRISTISLAQRVSRELGEPAGAVGTSGSVVGYAIRLESNTSRTTRLAFVTNGIALRMLEGGTGQDGRGTAFDEITHIIIDEVHERTIESDFLLIVLKSLLLQRPDLKVVLMSATVDAEKISSYFGGCPTLHVPGRTFPVDVRYLEDAIEFAQWKITEGSPYARRHNDRSNKGRIDWSEDTAAGDDDDEEVAQENVKLEKRYSSLTASTINLLDERLVPYDLIVRLLERICFEAPAYASYSSAILIFMPGMGEIRRLNDLLVEHHAFGSEDRFRVFPLHSTISSEQQAVVFDIPPPGIRKIVIATNIAETGITIPDITCVIDSGKHREMRFDEKRQISRLIETFVAKSNAAQRRGRAGRVQKGLCFHLFTKVRHDTRMADHPDPEMMRLSLSDLALRIKIMKVNLGTSIEDVLSCALDPPLPVNVQRAVSALVEVRALTPSQEITPMGRYLSKLPTDVHLGKFLLIAALFRCLDPALTIAATLNSKSPFLTPFGLAEEADRAKLSFRIENSDFLTIHNAFSSWRSACANGVARQFCKRNFLSHQNLQQIEELRQQFLGYLVDSSFIQVDRAFTKELSRSRYGRGRVRFVAVPAEYDRNSSNPMVINAALCAGLYPKILAVDPLKNSRDDLRTVANNQTVSFHPSSVNHGRKAREFGVNHLCYFTLMHSKKLYAWESGPVDDVALLLLCGEAEFKLMSDTVIIDRKIRFRVEPKAIVALKFLRNQLAQVLSTQFRGKPLTESQVLWNELALMLLGKVKIKDPEEKEEIMTLVVNRAL